MILITIIAILCIIVTVISFFIQAHNGTWEDFWFSNLKNTKKNSQISLSYDDELWLSNIEAKRRKVVIAKTIINSIILPVILFSFFYPIIRLAISEEIQSGNTTYRKGINEPLVLACFAILVVFILFGITYAALGGWRNKKIKPENEAVAQGIVFSIKLAGHTDVAFYYRALIAVKDLDKLLLFKETISQPEYGMTISTLKRGEKVTIIYDQIKPKTCK